MTEYGNFTAALALGSGLAAACLASWLSRRLLAVLRAVNPPWPVRLVLVLAGAVGLAMSGLGFLIVLAVGNPWFSPLVFFGGMSVTILFAVRQIDLWSSAERRRVRVAQQLGATGLVKRIDERIARNEDRRLVRIALEVQRLLLRLAAGVK